MTSKIKKLIPDNPRVLIQGITGKEGSRAAVSMQTYGTRVVAGVTPGKRGQIVSNVPVFDSIAEAINSKGMIDIVVQFVPPLSVLSASKEVFRSDIPFLLVGAEKVPLHDEIALRHLAKQHSTLLIGPGSVGMIVPSKNLKLGMLGGNNPGRVFAPGNIALLSKSGGMTSELGLHLKKHGLGVSLAVGVGGERVIGSDFSDLIGIIEDDPETRASVIFAEPGGWHEIRLAETLNDRPATKPIIAFICGDFVSSLGREIAFGHTGAILQSDTMGVEDKRTLLKSAGINVATRFDEIGLLLKKIL